MKRFFSADSGLWQIFGFVGDTVVLSLLWLLCSAPLVTAGAACCALYDAVVACFRRQEPDYLRRFLRTFRREIKNALLPTLLWGAVLVGAWLAVVKLANAGGPVVTALLLAVYLLPLGCACWVFPLLSRFTLGFSALGANAVRLALGHIGASYAMALGCALSVVLTLRLLLLPLFVLPALLALWFSLFLEPVFRRYEEQAEDRADK